MTDIQTDMMHVMTSRHIYNGHDIRKRHQILFMGLQLAYPPALVPLAI